MTDEKTSWRDYLKIKGGLRSIKRNILSFGLYLFIVHALVDLVLSLYLPLYTWSTTIFDDSLTAFTPIKILAVIIAIIVFKKSGGVSSL